MTRFFLPLLGTMSIALTALAALADTSSNLSGSILLDLNTVAPDGWTDTVKSLKFRQTIKIDQAHFKLIRHLNDSAGNRTFLVERLDEDRGRESILKINFGPHTRAADSRHWLPFEKMSLELQGTYSKDKRVKPLRTPKVYFLSQNNLVMEREYIKGLIVGDWLQELAQMGDSTDSLYMFSLVRLLRQVEATGTTFYDPHVFNIIFDREKDDEAVFFDGFAWKPAATDAEQLTPGRHSVLVRIKSVPITAFLYTLVTFALETMGDTPTALAWTIDFLDQFEFDDLAILRTVYGLNEVEQKFPQFYDYLVFQVNHVWLTEKGPDTSLAKRLNRFRSHFSAEEMNIAARKVFLNGLPGRQELKKLGYSPIMAQVRRTSDFCLHLLGSKNQSVMRPSL